MSADIAKISYENLDRIAEFLVTKGARQIQHGKRTLFEHLVGTAGYLIAAGAAEEVVYAGLCHSVYGTPFFSRNLLHADDRAQLQSLLGKYAEELVWNYSIYVPEEKLAELNDLRNHDPLMQIAVANRMDILDSATNGLQENST